jgi:GDPmannose 4,6-dehydratase
MWLMLQTKKPDDFVIASGETHTVREFVEEAAKHFDMRLVWKGEGLHERGVDEKTGKTIVTIDPRFFRPAEVDILIGDASKARRELGWKPTVGFQELARIMAEADMKSVKRTG